MTHTFFYLSYSSLKPFMVAIGNLETTSSSTWQRGAISSLEISVLLLIRWSVPLLLKDKDHVNASVGKHLVIVARMILKHTVLLV